MRNRKLGIFISALAAGMCLLSGCDQVDENLLNSEADTTVSISVPYATATPLPEHLDVPDPVIISSNGEVTVHDLSLILGSSNSKSDAASGYSTLNLGDTGFAVQTLQQRLKELGYFSGGVSGIFDAQTETAVIRFEQSYGIMQTGIATPDFQSRLFSASAVAYGTEAYDMAVVSQYSTLQRGAVGSSVYALQHRLRELGYPLDELTGVYDTSTEDAIRLFYEAYGLEPQPVAYIALQKELYSENARPYMIDGEVQTTEEDESTLALGNVGTLVMQIQNRLVTLGYLDAVPSGIFDAETEDAVRLFEEACGIEPTGKLTYALQAILLSDQVPDYGSVYAADETVYSNLSEGSSGEDVLRLQTRLIELGYASGSGNGYYGSETAAAVKMFQRYNNLAETGIASSEVQSHMFAHTAITYQDVLNGITSHEAVRPVAAATPAPSAELPVVEDVRKLSLGSFGSDVEALQTRLNALGYTCPTDGAYDESTTEAVRSIQSAIGVSRSGEATPTFRLYLNSNAAPANGISMYSATQPYTSLQAGDSGEAVANLQKCLWELGYLLTEDVQDSIGTFHAKTEMAVNSVQRAMGYPKTDGVASAEFQCFIFSEYAKYIRK